MYKGIKIIFHDTAGLRQGKNKIERLGIEKSKQTLESCDVALVIFDVTDADVPELLALVHNKPHIVVYNKIDLIQDPDCNCKKAMVCENSADAGNFACPLYASAKTGQGIHEIKQRIFNLAIKTNLSSDKLIITNKRHVLELEAAQDALQNALESLDGALPLDCVAADIQTALEHIGNITGTHTSELVIEQIFSRFCLGK